MVCPFSHTISLRSATDGHFWKNRPLEPEVFRMLKSSGKSGKGPSRCNRQTNRALFSLLPLSRAVIQGTPEEMETSDEIGQTQKRWGMPQSMAPHMCCRQPLHGRPGSAKRGRGHILTGSSVVFRFAGIAIKSFFLVLNKIGTLFRRTKLELIFIKDKI